MLASIPDLILSLPAGAALAIVFLIPALEASAFVGFVFPGEIAVILGGVLANEGKFPLWVAIVAAVLGAIIGDSVGYEVGKRWGDKLLRGTLGHVPIEGECVRVDGLEFCAERVQGRRIVSVIITRLVAPRGEEAQEPPATADRAE